MVTNLNLIEYIIAMRLSVNARQIINHSSPQLHLQSAINPAPNMNPDCIHLGIEVHPVETPPPQVEQPPQEKKQIKFKWSWRINMLALHKHLTKKFEGITEPPPKPVEPLEDELVYWSSQLANHPLYKMRQTKQELKDARLSRKVIKHISRNINKAWNSYHNYYQKKMKDKRLKQLKAKKFKERMKRPSKSKGPKPEELEKKRDEHFGSLARPKTVFPPAPPFLPKEWRPLEDLQERVYKLAEPKERDIIPPRDFTKITSAALIYEATDNMRKLALPPHYRIRHSETIIPGTVKRAALTAAISPRVNELAKPMANAAQVRRQEDDKYDPWVISPTALKYKATARILELAKPLERE